MLLFSPFLPECLRPLRLSQKNCDCGFSTTTLNTVYSQGDRFGLDNKVATSSFDETNEYSVPQARETEMSEVRSSTVTVSPYCEMPEVESI